MAGAEKAINARAIRMFFIFINPSPSTGGIEPNPSFKGFDGIISVTLLSMENLFPQ
jgi:hypothetical protein